MKPDIKPPAGDKKLGSLEDVITTAESLDVFPAAAAKIRTTADDPDSSLLDLEEAVSADPAVSALVLRVANSAFFGLSRTVGTLRDALFILGFRATRDLALSIALMATARGGGPLRQAVWSDAIRTAATSRLLSRDLKVVDDAESFVAGLLQDVGILVLLKVDKEHYEPVLRMFQAHDNDLVTAERSRYGFDHAELGGACLEKWQIPGAISHAVRYHHLAEQGIDKIPEAARAPAGLLHLAHRAQRMSKAGRKRPEIVDDLLKSPAGQHLKLSKNAVDAALSTLETEASRLGVMHMR